MQHFCMTLHDHSDDEDEDDPRPLNAAAAQVANNHVLNVNNFDMLMARLSLLSTSLPFWLTSTNASLTSTLRPSL
jgi:hypothetical protein